MGQMAYWTLFVTFCQTVTYINCNQFAIPWTVIGQSVVTKQEQLEAELWSSSYLPYLILALE